MKKLFMIFGLFAVVLCFPVKSYAITRYIINNGKVYYQRLKYRDEMTEADTPTFKNLDYFYAKDKNNVYYEGDKLPGVDPLTFRILDYSYTKDKDKVYYYRTALANVDPATFKILDIDYTKDKNSVYYAGKKIDGANPADFKILDPSWYLFYK